MRLQVFLKNNTARQKKKEKKLHGKKTFRFETWHVVGVENAKLVTQRCLDPNLCGTLSHVILLLNFAIRYEQPFHRTILSNLETY